MDFIMKIKQFFSYWYLRYLLATEMYMLERWERVTIHILLSVMFLILLNFNTSVLLSVVAYLRSPSTHKEEPVVNLGL